MLFLFLKNALCTKPDTMKTLQERIEHCLQPSAKVSVSDLRASTANCFKMQLHVLLCSNDAVSNLFYT